MKAKELLVLNPLFYTNLDKYIWINDSFEAHRAAQRLFDYLFKRKIYIKGFATKAESMIGLKMFNKMIIDISVLDKDNTVVFYDAYFGENDFHISDNVCCARVVNQELDRDEAVIWGSGVTGERLFKILKEHEIKVKYFIDSDEKQQCMIKCGVPVYGPEWLKGEKENVLIIEAMENWETLDEKICGRYINRFYFKLESDKINQKINSEIDGVKKELFSLNNFHMFTYVQGKKCYIYGCTSIEKEMIEYMELLDFNFIGFLVDDRECNIEEKYQVKYVEEVLYEEDCYIWVIDKEKVKKLDELGFRYFEDYICCGYLQDITAVRKNVLDVNLGYSYVSQSKYPGFAVYGSEKKENYKIVTLGGSTTDDSLYPFKSWTQLLYEKLEGRNMTVYNGGVGGYVSGQELLKLIRDVLRLEPDMVIVYDGFNDAEMSSQYPFMFNYLDKIFEYAGSHIETDTYIEDTNEAICRGIISKRDKFENWLSNIRTMYAITKERNISFFSFCQPVLCSKIGKSVAEKNMLLSMMSSKAANRIEESFRNYMRQMDNIPDYMYDLSYIFDNETDIYMDECHVWEKGNHIIAQEIKKIILPAIEKKRL